MTTTATTEAPRARLLLNLYARQFRAWWPLDGYSPLYREASSSLELFGRVMDAFELPRVGLLSISLDVGGAWAWVGDCYRDEGPEAVEERCTQAWEQAAGRLRRPGRGGGERSVATDPRSAPARPRHC